MMDTREPMFFEGQKVASVGDLFNDGSYPDVETNGLLISSGECGEVVQVGRHTDSGTFVYMVDFASKRVVGCLEAELKAAVIDGGAQ